MEEQDKIFKIYDEIDKIAFKLNGIYQLLFSLDLETLSSFVDNKGEAAKAFLCEQLKNNISTLNECNEKLYKTITSSSFDLLDNSETSNQSDD